MQPVKIAPSILSANFLELGKACAMVNESQADWFHIDVMDGVFVPNISFGFPVLKAIKKEAKKPLDVHLMIVEPDKYIQEFVSAGAEILTVHFEACTHLHRTLQAIKSAGAMGGVAINPHTPVQVLEELIQDIDLVCLMSVNPGFGGQSFIPASVDKCRRLRGLIDRSGSKALIEMDGGVGPENAAALKKAGAHVLVAGNSVFSAKDPARAIEGLKMA